MRPRGSGDAITETLSMFAPAGPIASSIERDVAARKPSHRDDPDPPVRQQVPYERRMDLSS